MSDRVDDIIDESDGSYPHPNQTLTCPILIVGGSTAAIAAALGALEGGAHVCLVQPGRELGGQWTAQALSASDDGSLMSTRASDTQVLGETFAISRTQRQFRDRLRQRQPVDGTVVANPGGGWVSHLAVTPMIAASVLQETLQPFVKSGQLILIPGADPLQVLMVNRTAGRRRVSGVVFGDRQRHCQFTVMAQITIEATDLGDVLELGQIESRIGQESRQQTGEAILPEVAYPFCQQAFTFGAIVEKTALGQGQMIAAPSGYNQVKWLNASEFTSTFWVNHGTPQSPQWQGHDFYDGELGIFRYRRLQRQTLQDPQCVNIGDVSVINWGTSPPGPMAANGSLDITVNRPRDEPDANTLCCGNDYRFGVLVGVSRETRQVQLQQARDRTQAYLHFLQTHGIDNLKPRGDLTRTDDGIALAPYIREARRGVALTTIRHEDVAAKFFPHSARARCFSDSIGIGQYHYLDFHPNLAPGQVELGDSKFSLPFSLPLTALIPSQTDGLLLSAKSIGTTHITNAAYRMHPMEWAIGEAGGQLAAWSWQHQLELRQIATHPAWIQSFQGAIARQGIPLFWLDDIAHNDPDFEAIQVLCASGLLLSQRQHHLHFQPDHPITRADMAIALVKVLKLPLTKAPPQTSFTDIPEDHRAFLSVETFVQHGRVPTHSVEHHDFEGDRPCTYQQLMNWLTSLTPTIPKALISLAIPEQQHLSRREGAQVLYSVLQFINASSAKDVND